MGSKFRRLSIVLLCFLLTLGIGPAFSAVYATSDSGGSPGGNYVPDEIIIGFYDRAQFPGQEKQYDDEVAKVIQDGLSMVRPDVYVVQSADFQKNPNATLNRYKNSKFVEYVEPNYTAQFDLTPNDPGYKSNQTAALNVLNAPAGWDVVTGGGPVIAVVDSGVAQHTDLPTLLPGYSAVASLSPNNDKVGHGTQVAGTFGMLGNNAKGGVGINWNASIMPVKVDDAAGTLTVANIAKGIMWAADNGAKIINMSLGTASDSVTLKNAVDYAYNKGCVLVAATGNDGKNGVSYPARYSNVLGVGGTASGATRAATSNYGVGNDITAINSSYTTMASGAYTTVAGTSFASPQVAGLASLVWAVDPTLTNVQVYNLIKQNAKPLGGGYNDNTGFGLMDMGKTLTAAAGGAKKVEPEPVKYALPPTINLSGADQVSLNVGDQYVESGFSAKDCLGVDVTSAVKVTSDVNTAAPGVYTITYEVKDAGGNTARVTRTVIVATAAVERPAPGAPVITPIGSNPIILHVGGTAYTEQGATANDETDGDLSGSVSTTGTVDTSKAGTYTITYNVTNSHGLEATATRQVRVLAPTEKIERTPYGFTGQGKIPTTITHKGIVADAAGFMDLNMSKLDNKMTVTVQLIDTSTNQAAFTDKFSAVGMKQYFIEAGSYNLNVTIDGGNGNCSYKVDLLMPEVRTATFAENEVPLAPSADTGTGTDVGTGADTTPAPNAAASPEVTSSPSTSTGTGVNYMLIIIIAIVVVVLLVVWFLLHRRAKKNQ